MIDKDKIKAGDKVKIEYSGLASKDWQMVFINPYGERRAGLDGLFLDNHNVSVTDHQPDLSHLEQAVENAKAAHTSAKQALESATESLAAARKALADAQPKKFQPGDRVTKTHDSGWFGTVVERPADRRDHLDNLVWVIWDDFISGSTYIVDYLIRKVDQ